jgi:hypothetical protein
MNRSYNTFSPIYGDVHVESNGISRYESPNINLNEHLKTIIKNEANLKLELISKTKLISELEKELETKTVKLHQSNQIMTQQEQKLSNLYKELETVTNELNNLKCDMKVLQTEINSKNKTIQNLNVDLHNKQIKLSEQETLIEKFAENVEIMQNMKNNIETLEKEKISLQTNNDKILFDITNLKNENFQNQDNITKQKNEISKITNDNLMLNSLIDDLKLELKTKEEEIKQLKQLNTSYQHNQMQLETQFKTTSFQNKENESTIIQLKNEYIYYINSINEDIESLSHWIENYLPIAFNNDNVKLPEVNLISTNKPTSYNTNNNNTNNNILDKTIQINLPMLVNSLYKNKEKIDKQLMNLQNENKKNKTALNAVSNDNFKTQKYLQTLYNNLKYEIESNNYFKVQPNQFNLDIDYQQEIESIMDKTFTLLHQLKENNSEKVIKMLNNDNITLQKEINDLKKLYENAKMQNTEIKNIQDENVNLKQQLNIFDQMKNENNKLIAEIINLNEYKNKTDVIIQQLELDKNNLIKDNVTLIQDNQQLKRQLYYIK